MNDPAGAILDGLAVAGVHGRLVVGVLFMLVIGLILLLSSLRRIFGERLAAQEYASLSLAGWLLPASLISLFWYAAALVLSPQVSFIATGLLLLAGLFLSVRNLEPMAESSKVVTISLVLLAVLFLLLRLAFIAQAVLPLYFDSAQHYDFIRRILAGVETGSVSNASLPGYYHLGFHFLAACITSLTRAEITDSMLVLGQVILASMPFAVFFIVRHRTRSNRAAFLALSLAAFGWYMPAHAVDWGKYPALASLALIPFVLILAYLYLENRSLLPRAKLRGLAVLLATGLIVSFLLHSRSLVVYGLAGIAWVITLLWNRMTIRKPRYLLLGIFLLFLIAEIILIRSQGILGPLLDAYGTNAILTGSLVLVLSFFAWRYYPGLVFFCVVSITLLLASLFIPLGNLIPGFANTTLLDRPYVQMVLYLPLTLLAGFGLAGLEQMLQGRSFRLGNSSFAWGKVIGSFFILAVIAIALFKYDLYPSDCCDIVSRDDLAAIHWLEENLPGDALILAASTDLKVLPTEGYQGSAGGDAGTWITPLTGRPVTYLPFNTDFSQRQILDALCRQNVSFVYVGETGWYFDDTGMRAQPEDYRLLLDLPKTRVYEVIGCE